MDRTSDQALAFAARRLAVERIAIVFAAREMGQALRGLPEVHVEPLGCRDARVLLESVLSAPLDDQVLERLVVETRGNPLALVELPRGLTASQLAGGFGVLAAAPVHAGIEESFLRRLAALSRDSRLLVLIAASDPTGDASLVWRAAERLGIPESAAFGAESNGLVAFRPGVAFRHPLVRSAVYRSAGSDERTEVHLALAEATNSKSDPDRRAWHRAQAAVMPDEDVAADLERSAARAQARGGFAAAAAFLERSAALTVEPARRAGRALAAGQAKHQSGATDDAVALLDQAEVGPLDGFQQAERRSFERNCVRHKPRERRATATPRRGSPTRATGRAAGARDLPRCPDRGAIHGTPGWDCRHSAGRRCGARRAPGIRSTPR